MSTESKRVITGVRVLRKGEPEPPDESWREMTPGERMAAVWTLTRAALGWQEGEEPRLDRSVVRVIRRRR